MKSHMIIWIDEEKGYDKIQHPFMIRMPSKPGIERQFLYLVKNIYQKTCK